MKNSSKPRNIFEEVIRKVVHEEVSGLNIGFNDLKIEFHELSNRFDGFEKKAEERHDAVTRMLDTTAGMFKKHDEDHMLLSSGHKRVLDMEDKIEKLEKIHPQSQHVVASRV